MTQFQQQNSTNVEVNIGETLFFNTEYPLKQGKGCCTCGMNLTP